MVLKLFLLVVPLFAMYGPGGQAPRYRDSNENGALCKDEGWSVRVLWRSFLRCCNVKEDSPKILQGLRDIDGNALITRWNIFDWSNFRRLPTEAGNTFQDQEAWLFEKLQEVERGIHIYAEKEREHNAERRLNAKEGQVAEEYHDLKERAEAALPLLRRVHAYYQRRSWIETLYAYIHGSVNRQHAQLSYTDPHGKHHTFTVASNGDHEIVFRRAVEDHDEDVPERLVLKENFANTWRLTGTDADGKAQASYLYYNPEHGWKVHYTDGRWWNNCKVTVKFLNFQDAQVPGGCVGPYC